jgi:hypothetical protein
MSILLENAHGVQIREDAMPYGEWGAANATCHCGEPLTVADHKEGDPVMVCGVHAYRFADLVPGRQPVKDQPKETERRARKAREWAAEARKVIGAKPK